MTAAEARQLAEPNAPLIQEKLKQSLFEEYKTIIAQIQSSAKCGFFYTCYDRISPENKERLKENVFRIFIKKSFVIIKYTGNMLIKLDYLKQKFDIKAQGFIHCGANMAQEHTDYLANGFTRGIYIDAIPDMVKYCNQILYNQPDFVAYEACLTDKDGEQLSFNIADNEGGSSSIFDFGTHEKYHPDVKFTKKIDVVTSRLDTLLSKKLVNVSDYTFWNMDIQGAEYLALLGAGDLLKQVDYLYCEVNWEELYKGGCTVEQVDSLLNEFGFKRVETVKLDFNWGDAFYIKP